MGIREQRSIMLQNKANGILNHLNYPQPQPSNIDFTQHIVAPLGEVILLEVHNVGISEADCHTANRIEVRYQCATHSFAISHAHTAPHTNYIHMFHLYFRFTIIMLTLMDRSGIYANCPRIITKAMPFCCHHPFT